MSTQVVEAVSDQSGLHNKILSQNKEEEERGVKGEKQEEKHNQQKHQLRKSGR
jgi:hypothetical protein